MLRTQTLSALFTALLLFCSMAALATSPGAHAGEFSPELVKKIEKERTARDLVRKENPKLFAAVSKAMFERDPIGINFKTNTDEYDAEAGTVIPRLTICSSWQDVATVLHEEFVRWFGAETAGPRTRYVELSKDIWGLWQGVRPNPSIERTSPGKQGAASNVKRYAVWNEH